MHAAPRRPGTARSAPPLRGGRAARVGLRRGEEAGGGARRRAARWRCGAAATAAAPQHGAARAQPCSGRWGSGPPAATTDGASLEQRLDLPNRLKSEVDVLPDRPGALERERDFAYGPVPRLQLEEGEPQM